MKSGEKALTRYAVEESHQYYKEGFDLLANKKDKSREENGLFIDLINEWASLEHCRGNAKAMDELLKAHQSLAESLGDKSRLGRFYVWLGGALFYRGKPKGAYQYLNRALKLGEETDNQWIVCYACAWLTNVCAELGLLEEGITFGERAQGIARLLPFDPHPVSTTPFFSSGYLYWVKGDTKKVFEYGKTLLDHGDKHSEFRRLAWGGVITGIAHQAHGNFEAAIKSLKDAVQISRDPFFRENARLCLGNLYLYRGQFKEAEETLEQAVAFMQKFGVGECEIMGKLYLGAALIGKGQMGRGLEMIEEAQWVFLENERRPFYAISEYILGKIYLQIAERAAPMTLSTIAKNIGFLVKNVPFAGKKAEYHFNKAIEVAKEIGAKGVQAQALLDLGLLHKAKGRMGQARKHISKSIELFEESGAEGFLKQAKEALASLG
jgi:tetratricopeptide (TPR) repeat protein